MPFKEDQTVPRKRLALIHTVHWYDTVITNPFVEPWLKETPDVEVFNIMDDSLLAEALDHGEATPAVIKRLQFYFMAAETMGADVAMCTCTTVALASITARNYVSIPVFNIDEPMAREAVSLGAKLGIVATVSTSPAATKRLLEHEASNVNKSVDIQIECDEKAFEYRMQGDIEKHDERVHAIMDRMAEKVDVLVLGQISLAQIKHETKVPVLQVGNSGFREAQRLLNQAGE
jgi:aspartate/glutamate racemase